jgi:hypothetical protein
LDLKTEQSPKIIELPKEIPKYLPKTVGQTTNFPHTSPASNKSKNKTIPLPALEMIEQNLDGQSLQLRNDQLTRKCPVTNNPNSPHFL